MIPNETYAPYKAAVEAIDESLETIGLGRAPQKWTSRSPTRTWRH